MATVNSIALQMILEQGESTDDSDYVTIVEGWINEALDEIAIATNWNTFRRRETLTTVIAEPQYQLAAGGREIIQIRHLDNGSPVNMWTVQEAARRRYNLEQSGRPQFWLEDGNVVDGSNVLYQYRLVPVPDSILDLEVESFYHPSEVATGSVLPVQDQHIVLIKDRVRMSYLERDQKYDAAQLRRLSFDANLARLVRRENRKVAAETRLRPSDIQRNRRPEAQFDPAHYNNGLGS